MASGSNPRRTQQRIQHDDSSTLQSYTPSSSTRLANIPKQAVEEVTDSLSGRIFPEDDDKRILKRLRHVWKDVQKVLEQDPKLKQYLASMEEFRDNVTKKGEKSFIGSLRAMATNSDTQGSNAWKDLLEDGTSFAFFALIVLTLFYV